MVKLKNIGGDVSVYAPAGASGAVPLEHGGVLELNGVVAKSADRRDIQDAGITDVPDDAIVVVLADGDVRAFPTSQWALVETKAEKATDSSREG